MKKLLFVAAAACGLLFTTDAQAQKTYGKSFKVAEAQSAEALSQKLEKEAKIPNVTVKGEIAQVCQAEGCWLKMKNPGGEDMLVKFKNHAFLIPKDTKGTATVFGTAVRKTISVEERRHMAEDAGQTKEEIAAITTPKSEVRIEAEGLVVE
jgi:hypothetical protein